MAPTTTTRSVKFHGWVLPKGSRVLVESLRLPIVEMGQQETTARIESQIHDFEGSISVPLSALDVIGLGDVPMFRHDMESGRDVLVS